LLTKELLTDEADLMAKLANLIHMSSR